MVEPADHAWAHCYAVLGDGETAATAAALALRRGGRSLSAVLAHARYQALLLAAVAPGGAGAAGAAPRGAAPIAPTAPVKRTTGGEASAGPRLGDPGGADPGVGPGARIRDPSAADPGFARLGLSEAEGGRRSAPVGSGVHDGDTEPGVPQEQGLPSTALSDSPETALVPDDLLQLATALAGTRTPVERAIIDLDHRVNRGRLSRALGLPATAAAMRVAEVSDAWGRELDPALLAWLGPGKCDALVEVLRSRHILPDALPLAGSEEPDGPERTATQNAAGDDPQVASPSVALAPRSPRAPLPGIAVAGATTTLPDAESAKPDRGAIPRVAPTPAAGAGAGPETAPGPTATAAADPGPTATAAAPADPAAPGAPADPTTLGRPTNSGAASGARAGTDVQRLPVTMDGLLAAGAAVAEHASNCEVCSDRRRSMVSVRALQAQAHVPPIPPAVRAAGAGGRFRLPGPLPPSIDARPGRRRRSRRLVMASAAAVLVVTASAVGALLVVFRHRPVRSGLAALLAVPEAGNALSITPGEVTTGASIGLRNSSAHRLSWQATPGASWLLVRPHAGDLGPGQAVQLDVDTTGNAPPGGARAIVSVSGSDGSVAAAVVFGPFIQPLGLAANLDRCTVRAQLVNNLGASVTLHYQSPGSDEQTVSMTMAQSADAFTATLPGSTSLTWWVTASDGRGASARSADDTLPSGGCNTT